MKKDLALASVQANEANFEHRVYQTNNLLTPYGTIAQTSLFLFRSVCVF